MVGQGGQEQRGDTDNNRKPDCDRTALAKLQHERRCDQDDRDRIIDQVGVDRLGDKAERHRLLLRAWLLERVPATRRALGPRSSIHDRPAAMLVNGCETCAPIPDRWCPPVQLDRLVGHAGPPTDRPSARVVRNRFMSVSMMRMYWRLDF